MGLLAAALIAMLALAPAAFGAPDPIAGGKTKLYLKKGFEKKLENRGVRVVKYGSGIVRNRQLQVSVDVSGGKVDPLTGLGRVTNRPSGGFKLRSGNRTVAIHDIEVNATKKLVRATVAGATMKLGYLSAISHSRQSFGTGLKSGRLKLTGHAARRISHLLGFRGYLRGGRVISNLWSNAQPSTVTVLPGQTNTQLTLSKTALAKLASLPAPVKLSLVPPAALAGTGTEGTPIAGFPISGGSISPFATAGTVMHTGGLKLEQNLGAGGVTTLEMGNIWLDLLTKAATVEVSVRNPTTPPLNLGALGRASIADIDLGTAVITPDPVNRKVSVQGGVATLQAVTAATLNQVFADPVKAGEVFKPGDPLGTFTFTAQTQ